MKLVDILARELKEWPEEWGIFCVSSKVEGSFAAWFGYRNPVFEDGGWSDIGTVELWLSEEPEDRKCVVVRRFEWQAAVDVMKAAENAVPQWSGEGLPPVGIDVEVFAEYSHPRFDRFLNQKVSVIAHDVINGDPVAVFRMPVDGYDTEQDYHAMVAGSFRPLRTPEQIAAEERDRCVQQMAKELKESDHKHGSLYALYDLGYRKFEIVDN